MKYGFFKSRKGITPVLSIVLLVMLMVGLILGVYMFLNGSVTKSQEQTEKTTSKVTESAGSQLKIESVWPDASNHVAFRLRNVGTTTYTANEIGNTSVFLNNVPATITSPATFSALAPQDTVDITLAETYQAGQTLRVEPVKGPAISKTLESA